MKNWKAGQQQVPYAQQQQTYQGYSSGKIQSGPPPYPHKIVHEEPFLWMYRRVGTFTFWRIFLGGAVIGIMLFLLSLALYSHFVSPIVLKF